MVHALRLSTFLVFIGLGLAIPLLVEPARRRRAINAFLAYILALNAFVAAAQTDAWPFSPYRMMAVDARLDTARSMIAFRGVDGEGREWDVEPLAWSPLFPQAIMGWFEVVFPRATPAEREEVVRFLFERAEERAAPAAGGDDGSGTSGCWAPGRPGHQPEPAGRGTSPRAPRRPSGLSRVLDAPGLPRRPWLRPPEPRLRVSPPVRRGAWDAFWYRPASPLGLMAARAIVSLQVLWLLLSRPDLPDILGWPRGFWTSADPMLLGRFFIFPVPVLVEKALYLLLQIALVLNVFGLVPRVAGFAAGVLVYHFAPFEDVFSSTGGPFFRGFSVAVPALLVLSFARIPRRGRCLSAEYRWPLALIQLLFSFTYLFSGVAKLMAVGPAWASARNFEGLVRGLMFPEVTPPWAHWFIGGRP